MHSALLRGLDGRHLRAVRLPPSAKEARGGLRLFRGGGWRIIIRFPDLRRMGAAHGKKKEYSVQAKFRHSNGKHAMNGSASMYSEIQRDPPDIGSILSHPDYLEGNPELIKPKKILNPVKASRSHQELHRELLMNHRRGLGIDKKPELQRVLEHRRRDKIIQQKKEEEELKKLQSPFEQELLKRQQRLEQLEREQEEVKEEGHAPEFIKVKENLRRTATLQERVE